MDKHPIQITSEDSKKNEVGLSLTESNVIAAEEKKVQFLTVSQNFGVLHCFKTPEISREKELDSIDSPPIPTTSLRVIMAPDK